MTFFIEAILFSPDNTYLKFLKVQKNENTRIISTTNCLYGSMKWTKSNTAGISVTTFNILILITVLSSLAASQGRSTFPYSIITYTQIHGFVFSVSFPISSLKHFSHAVRFCQMVLLDLQQLNLSLVIDNLDYVPGMEKNISREFTDLADMLCDEVRILHEL